MSIHIILFYGYKIDDWNRVKVQWLHHILSVTPQRQSCGCEGQWQCLRSGSAPPDSPAAACWPLSQYSAEEIKRLSQSIKPCVGGVDQASLAEGVVVPADCLPNSTFLHHTLEITLCTHGQNRLQRRQMEECGAHCVGGSIDVCGAAGVLGAVEGTCSVEVAVAIEEFMVVVAGFLQGEPKLSSMLGLPWLLYTLLFSLLLLSLLFVQDPQSLIQEIHLFQTKEK